MTTWPSGLRRWIKAPIFTGAGSNPVVVSFAVSPISYLPNLPIWGSHDGVLLCSTYFLTGRLHQSTAARAAGSIRAGVGSIGAYAFQVRLLLSSRRQNSPQAEELLHGSLNARSLCCRLALHGTWVARGRMAMRMEHK